MEAESAPADLVDQFCTITGADKGRAAFFLSATGNDLNLAVGEFFSSNQSRSATIHDRNDPGSDDDAQEFYAGGVTKQGGSGQNVIGPGKPKGTDNKPQDSDSLITDMFQQAREHGAEEMSTARSDFAGTGHNMHGTGSQPGSSRKTKTIILRMWKNGFSLNDGPLRDFDGPDNKAFLEQVMKGEVPKELQSGREKIEMDMEDHRDEDYKPPPKPAYIAFSGEGNAMGTDVCPPVSTSSSTSISTASSNLTLDQNAPVLQIQIRLSNGTRLVQKFNHSHTIQDLRDFVSSKSGTSVDGFKLMTTFPNKVLTENTQTLHAAGLANAVVMQR